MPDKLNLFCAIAAYRSVTTQTAHAFTRDMAYLATRHNVQIGTWSNDALISRTRSVMLSSFLDLSDADVLVWVDADITWRGPTRDYEGDIVRIARSAMKTKGIVGGVYSKRCFNKGVAVRCKEKIEGFDTGTDNLIPADAVSAGFMAVHKDALAAISPSLPYVTGSNGGWQPFCMPFVAEMDNNQVMLSEDWALCYRGHDHGVPCHIDSMPVLGHEGEYIFGVQDAFREVGE